MKDFDYEKIKEEAGRMGISPCLHMKRKVLYRKVSGSEAGCRMCYHMTYIDNKDPNEWNRKKGCKIIGFGIYKHGEVKFGYTCKEYIKI